MKKNLWIVWIVLGAIVLMATVEPALADYPKQTYSVKTLHFSGDTTGSHVLGSIKGGSGITVEVDDASWLDLSLINLRTGKVVGSARSVTKSKPAFFSIASGSDYQLKVTQTTGHRGPYKITVIISEP